MSKRLKAPLIYLAKKYPVFKNARYVYLKGRRDFSRQLYIRGKIDDKTIVFESFNGRGYSDSPRAIYEAILEDEAFADFNFIWALRRPGDYQEALRSRPRTIIVKYRSPRYFKAYARSKYWVTNTMLPLEVAKRPGQVLVQCWHGTPLKRLRNDIIEDTKNAMNSLKDFKRKNDADTVRYDYLISPSAFASGAFKSAFDLEHLGKENILIETGYPRNDFLFTYDESYVRRIKKKLNLPKGKNVLLYAPTWRDDQHEAAKGYVYRSSTDFDYLKKQLGDDWVILFRAHYMVANAFDFKKYQGFIVNVSDYDEVGDLYVISDVLMTDYSSVFFDYANLGRPMLFYMYDLEYYEKELRGFYFDIKELPGAILKTERQIVDNLKDLTAYQKEYSAKYQAFNKKFNYLDDAHASERVIDRVFKA